MTSSCKLIIHIATLQSGRLHGERNAEVRAERWVESAGDNLSVAALENLSDETRVERAQSLFVTVVDNDSINNEGES